MTNSLRGRLVAPTLTRRAASRAVYARPRHRAALDAAVTSLTRSAPTTRRLADLCGQFDENLRQIEQRLGVADQQSRQPLPVTGPSGGYGRRAAC